MIGALVVTHGNLSRELVRAAKKIVGDASHLQAVSIDWDGDVASAREIIGAALEELNSGDGVVILTDMFGGTPSNLAISIMEAAKVEVIAGLNLPMLIKLASVRKQEDLSGAVAAAQEAGRKYINVASSLLSGQQSAG